MKGEGVKFGAPLFADADVQVKTGQGKLWACMLVGGAALSKVDFYDNTSATGDPIMSMSAPTGTSVGPHYYFDVDGIPFNTGLFADISGSGAKAYYWFK